MLHGSMKRREENNDTLGDRNDSLGDIDRGWSWVVMFASFGSYCLIGATMYSMGIIHITLLDRYNAKVTTTSWAGALHSAVTFLGAPLASYVIDRVSCRVTIIVSGILYTTGFFLTAFAPNITVAIITDGLIAGLGASFGYTGSLVVIGFNFKRYRNIANGIALSGIGVGMFCLAPLVQWANAYYGTRGFFIMLAAISANLVTFGILCFPSKLELKIHRIRKSDMASKSSNRAQKCQFLKGYVHAISNKGVFGMCLCMFTYHCGLMSVFLYLPSYVRMKDIAPLQVSFMMSLIGITSAAGRVLTGLISIWNKFPDIILYSAPLIVVSVITFMLPFLPRTYSSYLVYSICLGLFFGGCFIVIPSLTLNFVTIQYLSTSLGLQILFFGLGSLTGPVFTGFLIDSLGSYDIAFFASAICCAVASILGFVSICFKTQGGDNAQDKREAEIEVFLEESYT